MNVQNTDSSIRRLFKNKPILSWSELLTSFGSSSIHNLVVNEEIVRVGKGRYALPGYKESSEYASWAMVAQKSARGVVCLLSALKYHGVTLQNPHQLWWAVPQGYHAPKVEYPSLKVLQYSLHSISDGVEETLADGMPIRIFCVTKTVADCFKFRNKIGLHVAIEALSDSWTKKKLDLNLLWKYAEVNRVQKIIQPYVDSLT